ncbi:MAG: hypothetical protein ACRCYY_05125 [Trueperaceae bacterium]
MKIDPAVRRKIERTLGSRVPAPNSEHYAPFLAQLQVTHPALAQELETAVILESVDDPKAQADRRALVAERLQALKRTLFYRYDELLDRWHISRLKLVAWGLVPVLALVGGVYLESVLRGSGSVKAQAQEVLDTVGSNLGFGTNLLNQGFTPVPELPTNMQVQGEDTEPVIVEHSEVAKAEPSPLQSKADSEEVTPPPPVLASFTREGAAKDLSVYTVEATEQVSDPFVGQTNQALQQVKTLSVYTAQLATKSLQASEPTTATRTLSVYEAGSSQLSMNSAEAASSAPAVGADPFATAGSEETVTTTEDVKQNQATSPRPEVEQNSANTAYEPGKKIAATLEVGIVTVDNETTPVIARGEDGSVWQGNATLSDTNRFTLEFTSVVKDGGTQTITARAVAEDGFADLPATVQETTPALASDLLRGSLQGVSNYVDDLSNQTTTVVDEFGKTITQAAPSLENQILGSVAGMFKPTTEQALVRVVELPAGTSFSILIF